MLSTLNSRLRPRGDIRGQWPEQVWPSPWGQEGGLEPLPREVTGAWLLWRRTSVKACRRHLISPAQVQRGKTRCQMGWNTWRSRLVKMGEGRESLGLREQMVRRGTRENLFLWTWKPHKWARLRCTTSLRGPRSILLLTCFFPSLKSDPKYKTLPPGNCPDFSSFVSCIFSLCYTWLRWFCVDLYSLIWSFLMAVSLLHLVQFWPSKENELLEGKGY